MSAFPSFFLALFCRLPMISNRDFYVILLSLNERNPPQGRDLRDNLGSAIFFSLTDTFALSAVSLFHRDFLTPQDNARGAR